MAHSSYWLGFPHPCCYKAGLLLATLWKDSFPQAHMITLVVLSVSYGWLLKSVYCSAISSRSSSNLCLVCMSRSCAALVIKDELQNLHVRLLVSLRSASLKIGRQCSAHKRYFILIISDFLAFFSIQSSVVQTPFL